MRFHLFLAIRSLLVTATLLLPSLGVTQGTTSEAQQAFYIGTDQHVHHFFAAPGNQWAHEDLNAATGAVPAATGSPLTSFEDILNSNVQLVFYIGTDQHVHDFSAVPGHPWAPQDLTAATRPSDHTLSPHKYKILPATKPHVLCPHRGFLQS